MDEHRRTIDQQTAGRDYHRELAEEVNLLRTEKRTLEAERDAYRDNAEQMNDAASRYLRRAEQAEKERDALQAAVTSLQERNLLFMRERDDARARLTIAVAALNRIADATDVPVCSERNRPWVTRFCEGTLAAVLNGERNASAES